jgi:hypothetical protein
MRAVFHVEEALVSKAACEKNTKTLTLAGSLAVLHAADGPEDTGAAPHSLDKKARSH